MPTRGSSRRPRPPGSSQAYPGGPGALAEAGFADAQAVLDGVRDLLSERWAEDAALVGKLREWLWAEARLQSKLVDGKDGQHADAAKFRDYFDYAEPIRTVPSHRALAVFRGRTQEWLDAKLVLDEEIVPGKPGPGRGTHRPPPGLEPRPAPR